MAWTSATASHIIEVWNKIDRLDEANRQRLLDEAQSHKDGPPIAISAITGEGIETLAELIEQRVSGALGAMDVTLKPSQLGQVDWIYRNGEVVSRDDNEDGSVTLHLMATRAARDEIEGRLRPRGKDSGE